MNLNKVILGGRLTATPELKHTANGVAVTSFTIAVDRRYSKDSEKKTDFISIAAWKQNAEFICKYFLKGSPIIICGELHVRKWTDADGKPRYMTEVVAGEISFAESKKSAETNSLTVEENATQGNFAPYTMDDFEAVQDEDLPF